MSLSIGSEKMLCGSWAKTSYESAVVQERLLQSNDVKLVSCMPKQYIFKPNGIQVSRPGSLF